MTTNFTKIKWAGQDCILVTTTNNHNPKLPILLLDKYDIEQLNKEFAKEVKGE